MYVLLAISSQGCAGGGRGGLCRSIFSNVQESWSNVSHAAKELTAAYSVTFL